MSTRQRLVECADAARPLVVAGLSGRGLSWAALQDLAAEALSFAVLRALETTPTLCSPEHERNWLARVAINHALDILVSEGRRRRLQERLHKRRRVEAAAPPSALHPFLELMPDALAELPPEDRRLIERRFFDGASLSELASEFDLGSVPTVHRRIKAILKRLRDIMES